MTPLLALTIDHRTKSEDIDRLHKNVREAVRELQALPHTSERVIKNKELVDGKVTPIAHGLGRPVYVFVSPPRGAVATGRIEEIRDGAHDLNKFVVLKASGWGATITVDLRVL